MTTGTPAPPRTEEYLFEEEGQSAVLRFTPEDEAWNIFTPDGVFVASFTRTGSEDGMFELESHRTGPVDENFIATDRHWPALVVRALVAAEGYEA